MNRLTTLIVLVAPSICLAPEPEIDNGEVHGGVYAGPQGVPQFAVWLTASRVKVWDLDGAQMTCEYKRTWELDYTYAGFVDYEAGTYEPFQGWEYPLPQAGRWMIRFILRNKNSPKIAVVLATIDVDI